jgi:hypothetical protein
MFPIQTQDEDSASAALSTLLVRCPQALATFCEMVDPVGVWAKSVSQLVVENQHRTNTGRKLDILIRNGNAAMIVECKVLDSVKPFQLRTYYDYWLAETGVAPLLVWLVQRRQRVIGWGSMQAREVTWNQVHDTFLKTFPNNTPVQLFCAALRQAHIVLPEEKCVAKRKLTKGYDQDHASSVLSGILSGLPDVVGSIEEVNELPPALHLARPSWHKKFLWITRVWVYFRPLSFECNTVCPFTYTASLRIFRHGERDTYEMEVDHFLPRSRICVEHGLRIRRNEPGKWRRWFDLDFPFAVPAKPGLRGITAYDPAELDSKPFFDWRSQAQAITAGVKFSQRFLKIVDKW